MNRRQLLAGSAVGLAGLTGLPRATAQTTSGKRLIVVLIEGGWDPTYCLDPKWGNDTIDGPEDDINGLAGTTEDVVTLGGITFAHNESKRRAVREFFEGVPEQDGAAIAGQGPRHTRCHVVNGIDAGSIAHDPCRARMLTGTFDMTRPDLAVIVGAAHGSNLPLGSLDLSGWSFSGSLAATTGRVGFQNQLKATVDPTAQFYAPLDAGFTYPIHEVAEEDDDAIVAFLQTRAEALRALRGEAPAGPNHARIDDILASIDRAGRFRAQGADLLKDLRIGAKSDFADQVIIAADMLEGGVCWSAFLDTRVEWDTHEINMVQHDNYDEAFTHLTTLYDELVRRGLFEDTIVAVISEMGRTPKLNLSGGKDHWAHTSALFFGGGIRGNTTTGATNESMTSMPVNLETGELDENGEIIHYYNLVAGILDLCEVDPQAWLPDIAPYRGLRA